MRRAKDDAVQRTKRILEAGGLTVSQAGLTRARGYSRTPEAAEMKSDEERSNSSRWPCPLTHPGMRRVATRGKPTDEVEYLGQRDGQG